MDKIDLEKRELQGKNCKKLLYENKIPGVIYNSKAESKMCQIDRGTAEKILQGITSSTMILANYAGQSIKVLVKEVDTDPRRDTLRHISFFEVDENVETTFEIPLELTGIAPAVKNNLGVLIQPTSSLIVKCKSKDLVPQIEVDVSSLENVGDFLLVKDIEIPEKLKLTNPEEEENYTVATITEMQREEPEEPLEEEEEGEGIEEGEGEEDADTSEEGDSHQEEKDE